MNSKIKQMLGFGLIRVRVGIDSHQGLFETDILHVLTFYKMSLWVLWYLDDFCYDALQGAPDQPAS